MLWLIKHREDVDIPGPSDDVAEGAVIRAPTNIKARMIMTEQAAGDEDKSIWMDNNLTSCEMLCSKGEDGIILLDFHAA